MNKKIGLLVLFIFVCVWSCKRDDETQATKDNRNNQTPEVSLLDTVTFQKNMKGWELYSWVSGSDWNYSLMVGTNRLKTFDEIIHNKVVVRGKENVKILLGKLPDYEQVLWAGNRFAGSLQLPSQSIIDEIKTFCNSEKITLAVLY